MNEEELLEALVPVRKYFTAKEVTRGTVLAAYLRSAGLRASGDTWMTSQAALGAGMSFDEAVEFAKKLGSSDDTADSLATSGHSLRSSAINRQTARDRIYDGHEFKIENSPLSSLENDLPSFEWFPKRTTAGDMDGEGLQKLLGAPGHDNLSVLIRETAQNSWDARREGVSPSLTYVLKRAEQKTIEWLRRNFQTDSNAQVGLRIQDSLERPGLRLLEISDRGTKGLGGPIRNDRKIPDSVPKDFVNLVLNIGVPRDVDKGGGTYGFGKIATYRASRCRTAIIWTHCATESGPEHRLIAVSLGQSFDLNNRMHTGHHWWGRIIREKNEDDRVEPLIGEEAKRLGELLFSTPFEDDFGTSILILDPDVEDEESGKLRSDDFVDIVLTQLWPKILPDYLNQTPMPIRLCIDGEEVPLKFPEADRTYSAYGNALNAIRQEQSGHGTRSFTRKGVEIHEVWSQRPKVLLGHLAVSSFVRNSSEKIEHTPAIPVNSVCLMRHSAELVVKYEGYSAIPESDMDWCGVFKPTALTDDAFAESEPPAHDDWLPESLDNRQHKIIVNVSKRERRNKIAGFVQPLAPQAVPSSGRTPTGELANALSWLVPSEENGSRHQSKPTLKKRAQRSVRKAGAITVRKQVRNILKFQESVEVILEIKLEEDIGVRRVVEVDVSAKTESGNEATSEIEVEWLDKESTRNNVAEMSGGEIAEIKVVFPTYLLAEVQFKVREAVNA